ncbi:hypothetical protein [Actinomarinicola tropica]|uniref:DUF1634 domain-containing protein n=1 Tax=Actinomarinicola tropica TaxID=2789776 RepID=A0A5Q2RHR3_9ACTN|nr:hypothetical protein [Actinomarinicola tropica]QGG95333.1 hypothetical protein GH723_09610 [Actinomarinicola tropica]
MSAPGPHPLVGRQRHLVTFLRALYVLAFALALAGVVLPGEAGDAAGTALVATLVAAPVLRIAWLLVRWIRRRDLRFAAVAFGLLVVIGAGAATTI